MKHQITEKREYLFSKKNILVSVVIVNQFRITFFHIEIMLFNSHLNTTTIC